MVLTGTKRSRPTSIVRRSPRRPRSRRPSRSRSGSPRAWTGRPGRRVLTLRISGRPEDAVAARRARRVIARRSNQRLLVEQNRCRSRSAERLLVRRRGLRGLAQHDPAVGLAAGEVAALAVGGGTAYGLDRERGTGLGEPAGDPRRRGPRRGCRSWRRRPARSPASMQLCRAGRCRAARCRGRRGRAGTTRGRGPRAS